MKEMQLRHLATLDNSNVDKLTVRGEVPVRLCNYVDVYKNDRITADIKFMAASATSKEIEKFRLKVGDVLITKDSEDRNDIAVPAYVSEAAPDIVCGYHLTLLRARKSRSRGDYLFWALQSQQVREAFSNAAGGVTRYGLTLEGMKSVRVPVPDLTTQSAIADFLDRETARIDKLIAKKERLIGALDEKFSALRNFMFRSIPNEYFRPMRWTIDEICDGPFGSGLTSAHYCESGVRVVRLQNIKDGGFDESDAAFISIDHYESLGNHDVREGDLLIAGLGDDRNKVGRACVAPVGIEPAMVKADCYRVRMDSRIVTHSFVAEYLCSDESWFQIQALAKGVTRSRLNLELVRRVMIPAPGKNEQNAIVAELRDRRERTTSIKNHIFTSIDRLREFRSALITAAVTGQIDVTTWGKQGSTDRRLDQIEKEMAS